MSEGIGGGRVYYGSGLLINNLNKNNKIGLINILKLILYIITCDQHVG